jgi:hypothetical protein
MAALAFLMAERKCSGVTIVWFMVKLLDQLDRVKKDLLSLLVWSIEPNLGDF